MSNLIGDVKSDLIDPDSAENFLIELELLMLRYKIDKIDISWKKFNKIKE